MHPEPDRADSAVRLSAVALPAEHGGWGFLGEAVTLTLLAAPGPAALPLALSALAGFLAHHPLRLWIGDRLRGRSVPRTRVAARLAMALGAAAGIALGLALLRASRPGLLLAPLVLALLASGLQLFHHVRGRGRSLTAELLGSAAPGGIAAAAALGHDRAFAAAATLWAVLLARDLPAVLLVRARLRIDRGQPAAPGRCHLAHALVLAGSAALSYVGVLPGAAVAVFAALWSRAALGLAWTRPVPPRTLGIAELVVGLAAATALGLSLRPPS